MPRGKFQDLTGQVFGKLTVLRRMENHGRDVCYVCRCICGREKEVVAKHLRSGGVRSCGSPECRGYRQADAPKQPRKPRAGGRGQFPKMDITNRKGLCYNVMCPIRNNYRATVWSCSRCSKCPDRQTQRKSVKVGAYEYGKTPVQNF